MTTPVAASTQQTVVHVIDSLGQVGGAEQQLVENLRRFQDPRLHHRVLCLYELQTNSRQGELPREVTVEYVFPEGATPHRPKIIAATTAALRRIGPDVIHCGLPNAALAARIAGLVLGVPVFESLVNISHEAVRTTDNPAVHPWKLAAHRTVDRISMRSVARFQALSKAVERSWIETVGIPPERVVVIPRGVDTDLYGGPNLVSVRTDLLGGLGFSPDSFVVMNIGRQVPQKGQVYAIRALAELIRDVPEAVLLSAGTTGPSSGELRAEARRLGVSERVAWLGVRTDIPQLLEAADAFLFPSLYEGLGVSLLQAMASSLPVVTTGVAPMTEVVEHETNGLLVPPQDPAGIAAALRRLAGDPEFAAGLGAAGRATIATRFDSAVAAEQVESVYRELLGMAVQ